ncbi:MAG: hypothetical protein ACREXS_21505 [Gammaproteobacteria bacterium]
MPSTDEKNIIIPKIKFQVACGITGVILIALLFWVYELSKATGFRSELVKALATEPVASALLVNDKGGVSYFNRKGKPLMPCASIEGTKVVPVEGGCGLAGEIKNLNSITVFVTQSSPSCEWVTDDNGKKLYKIHASGEYEGEDPCHEKGAHAR